MDIRPIRNETDLAWAIDEIAAYFETPPEQGTQDADRFDLLSDLIEAYENKHHPIAAPDPIAMITFVMENKGFSQVDLGKLLGSPSRASEILARKRRLNLSMVRKISEAWNIPADTLISDYPLAA